MIANYDRCHLMQSAKKKSHPTELYRTRSRTNIVSAREIGRQLEGEAKSSVSKAHFKHYFPVETRLAASPARRRGKPRLYRKRQSRLVRGLTKRGRGVFGKFLLGGLRPLDLELVEQKRRADHAEPDGFRAVLDRGRGSGGNEIAAQGADVEISEDAAANQFFID